jgi:hypothetical protein
MIFSNNISPFQGLIPFDGMLPPAVLIAVNFNQIIVNTKINGYELCRGLFIYSHFVA